MKRLFTMPSLKMCFIILLFLLPFQKSSAQTFWYYNGTGPINNVSSWGTNTNGTGGTLTDFTSGGRYFIIQNTTAVTVNGIWNIGNSNLGISGGDSLIIGNPSVAAAPITITLPTGSAITVNRASTISVSAPSSGNHKIIYQNTTVLSLGIINDPNLELVFDGTTLTTSSARSFGKVSLINNANVNMGAASITLKDLIVDAGSTLSGPIGSSSNFIAIKPGGSVLINGTFRAGRTGTITAPGRGGLYTTGVALPVVPATTNATLLFQDANEPPNITLGSNSTVDYYRGTSSQTGTQGVSPLAYANLTLSNSAVASDKTFADGTISVSGTFTINLIGAAAVTAPTSARTINILPTGKLVINSATTFPTGGRVFLKSDETGTASIGELASGASITGNVSIEQFIPSGFRRYRFLSHPFTTSQPLSQITDEIDITGNTAGTTGESGQTVGSGFTATTTNNPSAFFFNTASANGNSPTDGGWSAFTDATTNSWAKGQGIRVLVRGTKNQAGILDGTNSLPNAVTLSMAGTVNTGAQAISLVTGGSGATAGFNFVGNPFASPVNIGAVLTAAGANVANTFYVRNPQTGSYTTINPIPVNYTLPAYSAFFVKANNATTLNFLENNKSNCTSCPIVFNANDKAENRIEIRAMQNGLQYDNLYVNVGAYSEAFSGKENATKMINDVLNVYSLGSKAERLAVNYIDNQIDTIALGISLSRAAGKQNYSLSFAGSNIKTGFKFILLDVLTNTKTNISENEVYNLEVDPTNEQSVGNNRLKIIVHKVANEVVRDNILVNQNSITITPAKQGFIVKNNTGKNLNKASCNFINMQGKVLFSKVVDIKNGDSFLIATKQLAKGVNVIQIIADEIMMANKVVNF